jgi:hypothetical protein
MAIFKGPVLGSNVVRLFSNLIRFLLGPISIVLDPAVFEIRQKNFDRSTLISIL